MSPEAKPILVTGSHRSGTTWAGRMLAAAPRVAYINEPFNIQRITANPRPFGRWFTYVQGENAEDAGTSFDRIMRYQYPLGTNLGRVRTLADLVKVVVDQGRSLWYRTNRYRPLVKDPIAFFSAEWLCERFDMEVLVMIRHPAAFCSSLKIKQWKFPFDHLLDQPRLMQRYLHPFEAQVREFAGKDREVIEQAALLWNCIHHTVRIYQESHPTWVFLRHEDLSADPLEQFRSIYDRFDLEFTEEAVRSIALSSGSHNPAEQQIGNEYVRDSKANIRNWKTRLSEHEITTIRDLTGEVAGEFYGEQDW